MLNKLDKAVDFCYKAMLMITLIGIVVCVTMQIVCRYILSAPLLWTDEYSRLFFCWSVMMGAAVCCREDSHLEVDVIYSHCSPKGKKFLDIFNHLLMFVTSGVVLVSSIQKIIGEQGKASLATKTPTWVITTAVLLGSIGMTVYSLLWAYRYWKGEKKDA